MATIALKKGYAKRMRIYLNEMYPVWIRLAGAALLYAAITMTLQRAHGFELDILNRWSLIGVASVFSLLLVLRLMDEFKDRDIDERLFPDRPLPSGRVLAADLRTTLILACVAYLGVNTLAGPAFWTALLVLGYAFLMYRFFFMPEAMRRSLPLALVSHNPIVAILAAHLVCLFVVQYDKPLAEVDWVSTALVIAIVWASGFAWEISRKIRSREEEDEYVTYSQLLGPIGAITVAGSAQAFAFVISAYLTFTTHLSALLPALAGVGLVSTLAAYTQFALHPSPRTSKLTRPAERFMICMLVGLIAGSFCPTI